jgi:hypothetical protein
MSFLSMFIKNVKVHFKRLGTPSNIYILKIYVKHSIPTMSMCKIFLQIVNFFVQFLQRELFVVVDMVMKLNYENVLIKTKHLKNKMQIFMEKVMEQD